MLVVYNFGCTVIRFTRSVLLFASLLRIRAVTDRSKARTTNPILGNMSLAGLHNVLAQPSMANSDIPDLLYACFGFTFVTCTAMVLAGAMLERGRLFPSMLFLLCWTTFVYYVLAYWEWNPSGWLLKLGVLDFAGKKVLLNAVVLLTDLML